MTDNARAGEDVTEVGPFLNRYVRLRCPICDLTSPVCDQQEDVPRAMLGRWWQNHKALHLPHPIIERAEKP